MDYDGSDWYGRPMPPLAEDYVRAKESAAKQQREANEQWSRQRREREELKEEVKQEVLEELGLTTK